MPGPELDRKAPKADISLATKAKRIFSTLEIRFKFLVSFALIFFLSILLCNLFIYVYVRNNIESRIESELTNTTQMIYNMVTASVTVSIKNYLRAVAEKNLDIVSSMYTKFQEGTLSEQEAKSRAAEVILSQAIGSSGYLYCLDSQGKVTVHPKAALIGTSVKDFSFVQHMTLSKEGYLEYDWKKSRREPAPGKGVVYVLFQTLGLGDFRQCLPG